MTQPTPYRRGYDFADAGGALPPGGPLDGELDNLGLTVSQILRNLALLQRDDTGLRNGIVGIDALDNRVLGLLSGGTFTIAGTWATATSYAAGAFFSDDEAIYLTMEAHTSVSIIDDLAAGHIVKVLQNEQGERLRDDFTGDGVTTVFTLSQSPARPADVEVYVEGLLVPAADYAQTGATVTFDVAPTNGDKISIFSIVWSTTPPIQTLVDAVGDRNTEISAATQFLEDVELAGGAGLMGFSQTGTGAIARTAEAKLRESVSVEDFYSGDFADALEAASAVATTVHIHGAAYTVDRIITLAANTDIVMHGGTISRAGGYTGTHFITCAGNWSISGNGTFDGLGMTAPVANWAGVGIPQGSCIYAAGANIGSRISTGRISAGIKFIRFPSGPVYVKWLKGLYVDGVELDGCQSATVQWKASGSYTNIPGTTNAGTSTAPVGEIVTSAGIEAYQCAVASVTNSIIPAVSKGISLSADLAISTGNSFSFGTPRHCQEHLVSSARVFSHGNSYDGGADNGDGYKIVTCDSGISGGHVFTDNAYCGYIQDSDNIQLGPDTAAGVTQRAYAFTNTSAAGGRALTNISLQIGSLKGVSGSNVLYIQTDAGAITAGYTMNFEISGGVVSGFDSLVSNGTVGLGGILDYSWKGTVVSGATGSLDLRVRGAEIDLVCKNCVSPLVDVGSTVGGAGAAIDGAVSVNLTALNCTGTAAPIRHAAAAGGSYEGKFTDLNYVVRSSGCTFDKAFALTLGAADTIRMLNLDLNCPDLDPNNSGSSGQAISFDANSKTFKARVRLNVLGLGTATPMNVTFTNAGSMTGVLEKPISGTVTGGALTAV